MSFRAAGRPDTSSSRLSPPARDPGQPDGRGIRAEFQARCPDSFFYGPVSQETESFCRCYSCWCCRDPWPSLSPGNPVSLLGPSCPPRSPVPRDNRASRKLLRGRTLPRTLGCLRIRGGRLMLFDDSRYLSRTGAAASFLKFRNGDRCPLDALYRPGNVALVLLLREASNRV